MPDPTKHQQDIKETPTPDPRGQRTGSSKDRAPNVAVQRTNLAFAEKARKKVVDKLEAETEAEKGNREEETQKAAETTAADKDTQ